MKQMIFLMGLLFSSAIGSIYQPFWGVAVYYLLAVLRPQYIWAWSLPPGWRWSLAAAAIVLVSFVFRIHTAIPRLRLNAVTGPMVVFSLLLMFSCVTAFDPLLAQGYAIEYAKIIGLAVIGGALISSLSQLRWMVLVVFLGLGYVAWDINALYIFDGRLDIYHRGFGGLDNNGAALMLAMGAPLALAFALGGTRRWHRLGAGFLGLLIVHAVLMSYSRGAMVASLVGVVWMLVHHRRRFEAVVAAAIITAAVSVMAGPEIRARFYSTANYRQDESAASRFNSWSAAWQMAVDNPVLGQGIRNAGEYTLNYGVGQQGRTIHSQYLQIAADSGIPAMLVYTAMVGLALANLYHCRRLCLDRIDHPPDGAAPLDDHEHRDMHLYALVAMACHCSLLIFAVGAVFLSLEVFELPWMMLVVAGLFPGLLREHMDQLTPSTEAPAPAAPSSPAPQRARLRLAGVLSR